MHRFVMTPALPISRQLRRLQHEMLESVFDALGTGLPQRTWVPAANLIQRQEAYELHLALPGVPRDEVQLSVEGDVLVIRGQRPVTESGDQDRWWMAEVPSGSFERRFQLPEGMGGEGISARFEDGMLRVRLPMASAPSARLIPIDGNLTERTTVAEVVEA
jgi:HSP20 family protein